MAELAPIVELRADQKPRRIANLMARLREAVEPPFPNVSEYIGPEDNSLVLKAIRRVSGFRRSTN